MPKITEAAIHAYTAALIRDHIAGIDYHDLANHMFDDTTIDGVKLAKLDRPYLDSLQRRVLDLVHTAIVITGWPNIGLADSMPAGRLYAWADTVRHLPADEHTPMPLDILGDLVAVLNEQTVLVDHLIECPELAADDPYGLAACRVCGCTEDAACDGGCSWVPDPWQGGRLCTSCLPADPAQWLEPPQDLTEFEIDAMYADDDRPVYVRVSHVPCQTIVVGLPGHPDHLDVDDLLELVATHQCDHVAEPRDVSQFIDVPVDGETVTAAIHGSRLLDAEEQAAMGEVLTVTWRLDRERRREERRQRDEDVRAVDAVVIARANVDHDLLHVAIRELGARFADRIVELRQRGHAQHTLADRIAEVDEDDVTRFEADPAERDRRIEGGAPADESDRP